MTKRDALKFLKENNACEEAVRFARKHKNPQEAWSNCERPDWMMWYLRRVSVDIKLLLKIACRCVRETKLHDGRTVWDLLTDERSKAAIEAVERYINGEATIEETRLARAAAAAAAAAYAAAAVGYADAAAAYAADAAAAYAAVGYADAAAAAAAAAYAAAYAADDAARKGAKQQQANIIREFFPEVPTAAAKDNE